MRAETFSAGWRTGHLLTSGALAIRMAHYEATFEINSETDSHAVRLLTERAYNTIREELRQTDQDDAALNETLQQFKTIREAASRPAPGTLKISYEQHNETFND